MAGAQPGEKTRTPIMAAVAYNPHLLYCPLQLWVVNLATSLSLGLVIGILMGGGARLEPTMISFAALHISFAFRYRRDRHLWSVLMAKAVTGEPFPVWPRAVRQTRNLRRRRGANHFH